MWSCNGCRPQADKSTDTVKIDFASLENSGDKENESPQAPAATNKLEVVKKQKQDWKEEEKRQHREQEEWERQQREEELQREKECELQEQQEQMRRLAEEQQRRLAEEHRKAEEQKRLQHEAEQAELRRQEEERQLLEEERLKQEHLRAEAEARKRAEKEEKQWKLNSFFTSAGFKTVNEQKQKSGIVSSSFTYPLHVAVKANNLEAVELLLWAGADKAQIDSSKFTPAALARKLNRKDSHKAILAALGE